MIYAIYKYCSRKIRRIVFNFVTSFQLLLPLQLDSAFTGNKSVVKQNQCSFLLPSLNLELSTDKKIHMIPAEPQALSVGFNAGHMNRRSQDLSNRNKYSIRSE